MGSMGQIYMAGVRGMDGAQATQHVLFQYKRARRKWKRPGGHGPKCLLGPLKPYGPMGPMGPMGPWAQF